MEEGDIRSGDLHIIQIRSWSDLWIVQQVSAKCQKWVDVIEIDERN